MKSKQNTKNLTLIILLLIGIILGVSLVSHPVLFFPKAAPSFTPEEVTISNIADSSFTVSWMTSVKTKGLITYGTKEPTGSTEIDDRSDTEGYTHHVTLKKLEPNTNYLFKIVSGSNSYDDKGQPYRQ